MLKINLNSTKQINIVPAKYNLETNNDHKNAFRTIPINNSDDKKAHQGFIKPDKLEKKPPTGAATINRKMKEPKNMQRRTSCPDHIYDQIYEDIALSMFYI